MYYRILCQSSLLFIWYRSCFNEKKEAGRDPTTLFHLMLRLIMTGVSFLATHTPWWRGQEQLYFYYFLYDLSHDYYIKHK
jgi:hypothetical protein